MNAKGEKNRERIDLGIGAILAGSPAEGDGVISIDLNATQSATPSHQSWTLGGMEGPQKGEFDILADERKWEEILRRVEPRLGDKGDFEARLWWVRGHLGAFSMPVTFLAAPLEAICREILPSEVSGSVLALLRETGILALSRLEEIGEVHQATTLRTSLEALGIKQPRGAERKRLGTSSFRALEFQTPALGSQGIGTQTPPVQIVARGKRPHRVVWTIACVALVAAIVFVDRLVPNLRSSKLESASESFISEPHGVELSRPVVERKEPGGRLGALFYSLERESGAGGTGSSAVAGPRVGPSVSQDLPPHPDSMSAAPERGVASPHQSSQPKERVNTDGPIEGPDFRRGVVRTPPLESLSRREELRGGPPSAVLPGTAQRGFENQRTYRVLAKTSVLSAPSYGGRVIGQLERGDRVLVEGKLGRWLRLRSKKGRGGYVIAADVEEVQDLRND